MEYDFKKFKKDVAKQLTAQRWMQELSQEEIARRLGTTKSSISRLESGEQNISVETAAKYSYALGMRPVFQMVVQEDIGLYDASTKEYSLKLFDEELVRFHMTDDLGTHVHILQVEEDKRHLLPIGLELTDEGLLHWMKKRVVPKNRAFVDEILGAYNMNARNTKALMDLCKGLSLNDSYWVVPAKGNHRFDDWNLYDHEFMEILAVIAYTGAPHSLKIFETSPEYTTGGMLRKAWRNKGSDGIWLYKGGTEGFANTGNEPFSEALAWQIAKRMGLNAVPYELENWKGILASKCKLFTNRYYSYVPMGNVVREGGIQACLEYSKDLGQVFYDQLCSMLVFDALIYNEDRHFGNFGLLRENRTGEFAAPAPIFDNGLSLFCMAMKDDFGDLSSYAAKRRNPYGISYETLCARVMGPLQKKQLRRLIGFHFEELEPVSLPQWRIKAIEEQLQVRIKELLAL